MSDHLIYHDLGATLRGLSGLLFLALGVAVFSVKPRLPANVAFATFASAFGLGYILRNIWRPDVPGSEAMYMATSPLFMVAGVMLILVAAWFPRPLRKSEMRLLILPGIIWLIGLTLHIQRYSIGLSRYFDGLGAGFWAALMILALRFDQARADQVPSEAKQIALASATLAMYPAYFAGEAGLYGQGYGTVEDAVWNDNLVLAIVLMVTWFILFLRADRATRPAARNLMFLIPGIVLATAVLRLIAGPEWVSPGTGIGRGIIRTFAVLAFAYAIVRHQLFGIDVKVRWTISKGTLAGIFVAVFFVASEAAQEFFGATLGSSYVGILAAGMLVFAIAPLSRFADHVARKAVPLTVRDATVAKTGRDAEEVFRASLRMVLTDRRLSPDEELHLADLGEHLGLSARRAMELRREVQQEVDR